MNTIDQNKQHYEQVHEEKRQLVLSAVAKYCTADSEFEDLALLGAALDSGDELKCKTLSGGKANHSYKIFLRGDPNKAIFAKLTFDVAAFDNSVRYDLTRTDNEFELMSRFYKMMGGKDAFVVQPYHLLNLDEHTKLLISQWAPGDEQWATQFIDGVVEKRPLNKLAEALATINLVEVDPMFNDNARPFLVSLFAQFKGIFKQTLNVSGDPHDSSIALAKEIGQTEFDKMIDNMSANYMERDCLVHNDIHVFNLLVEKKPTPTQFGEKGAVYICDWEMAVAGPQGADPGKFISYPIACALCHAMNGNRKAAYHLMECITEFWEAYEAIIVNRGKKDESSMADIHRQALGWAAYFIYGVFYQLNLFSDTLPMEDLSPEDQARARGAYAFVGLRLMQIAYGSDSKQRSLSDSKALLSELMGNQIESLLDVASVATMKRNCPRQSSMLRLAERRVSDVMVMEGVALRVSQL